MEISRKLVASILRKDIISIQDEGDYIGFKEADVDYGLAECELISITDFAFINCIDWAFDRGYELRSGRDVDSKEKKVFFCEYKKEKQANYIDSHYLVADRGSEAIIKVCELIQSKNIKG